MKFFRKIGAWFKSLFTKKSEAITVDDKPVIKNAEPVKALFEKLYDEGIFNRDGEVNESILEEELRKSARAYNGRVDTYHFGIQRGLIQKDEAIQGLAKDEEARDKTKLKRQEMKLKDEEAKKAESKNSKTIKLPNTTSKIPDVLKDAMMKGNNN